MELLFYTTSQCHLCELAEALLVSTPMPEPIPVDVVVVRILADAWPTTAGDVIAAEPFMG